MRFCRWACLISSLLRCSARYLIASSWSMSFATFPPTGSTLRIPTGAHIGGNTAFRAGSGQGQP